jgi:hypothetical protein
LTRVKCTALMDIQAIGTIFGASAALTVVGFWLDGLLAGTKGRPGAASMVAFVLGWLSGLTALLTGLFLLMVAVSG